MADTPTYNFLLQLCSFVSHGFLASHLQQTDVNKVRLHVASHVYKFPTQEIDANKSILHMSLLLEKGPQTVVPHKRPYCPWGQQTPAHPNAGPEKPQHQTVLSRNRLHRTMQAQNREEPKSPPEKPQRQTVLSRNRLHRTMQARKPTPNTKLC